MLAQIIGIALLSLAIRPGHGQLDDPILVVARVGHAPSYATLPDDHVRCSTAALARALRAGDGSSASRPRNSSLPVPVRNANPIDIANGSPVAESNEGVDGTTGIMVFPNLNHGTRAALDSIGEYLKKGYTVYGVVRKWAPPEANPNAMRNTLRGLGISVKMARSTLLYSLTAKQRLQLIAAFTWQEGFKPPGC